MRYARLSVVGSLLLALVWTLAAVDFSQAQPKVIKLGATIALTGSASSTGKLYVDGRQLGLDTLNKPENAIKIGNDTYQIQLVQYDDQSDANLAVRLYEKLVTEDKVDFLIGPYTSGIVIPTSAVAEKYNIPMVQGGGASTNIFTRGFKNVFGTLPPGQDYHKEAVKMFAAAGYKTMALIYADDAFSTDVGAGTRKYAEQAGFKIIIEEKYKNNETQFSSLVAKIKEANPDVIMSANHFGEAVAFVQQARSSGLDKDMVFTVGVSDPNFVKTLGAAAERVFGVEPWVPTLKSACGPIFNCASDYAKLFETGKDKNDAQVFKGFGYTPEYHNANGTIELLTYKYAIEKAGSLDKDKVREALKAISFDSFYGPVKFSVNGQIDKSLVVIQIQNGKAVSVSPDADAVSKPIFKKTQ
ncbi:amino acid ABC transporter substrate-binding protein [Candidatus Acetothermia bacterium]|nr:amino acid ABC transporter substrate-binding protein [Candidatus Acetothermia bacterium]